MNELEDFFAANEKYAASARSQDLIFYLDLYDLYVFNPELSMKVIVNPVYGLQDIQSCLCRVVVSDGVDIPKKIKILNLIETINLRNIDESNIGQFIQAEGIITSVSAPEPEPTIAAFICPKCNEVVYEEQDGFTLRFPKKCTGAKCHNRSFSVDDIDRKRSTYKYIQRIEVQERPEELPPGEIPESLTILLQDDLIRTVTPGDRTKIVGVLEAVPLKPRKLDFTNILIANNVTVENKDFDIEITEEEFGQFKEISEAPDAMARMVNSFAPSIYGWNHIKEVLLLALFGGVSKNKNDSDVRGNINILMLGDPGTSKSQLLKYCHKISHRSVFSTGRGVTGVGLTAALVREDERFVLRAGSMALADMGICCIDEGEKMKKEDRDSIHTPMEQQIIPIQKGGLNTTLNARCATLMAVNPTDGRYNRYKTIPQNIKDFPESLLSRFDFIFIMPDIINEENDLQIANRILQLDSKPLKNRISFTTLKKYIIYSKRFNPIAPPEVNEYLREQFLEKRKSQNDASGLQVSWRQLESLERACEARARAHHRETVTIQDAEATIRLFEIYVQATWTDPYTGKVDMNVYEGLPPDSRIKQAEYLPRIIEQIYHDGKGVPGFDGELYVRRRDLVDELMAKGHLDNYSANQVIRLALEKDLVWSPGPDKIKITGDRNRMLGDEEQSLNTS